MDRVRRSASVPEKGVMLAAAHNNLGAALKDAGRLAEAEDCFREAVRLSPQNFEARSNLLYTLLYDGPQAAPELIKLLKSDNAPMRKAAAEILGNIGSEWAEGK